MGKALLVALVSVILICLIGAAFLMWSWNAVMPQVFGLTTITWTQALLLMLVSTLLFWRSGGSASKS